MGEEDHAAEASLEVEAASAVEVGLVRGWVYYYLAYWRKETCVSLMNGMVALRGEDHHGAGESGKCPEVADDLEGDVEVGHSYLQGR